MWRISVCGEYLTKCKHNNFWLRPESRPVVEWAGETTYNWILNRVPPDTCWWSEVTCPQNRAGGFSLMKYLTNKIRKDLRFSRRRVWKMTIFLDIAPWWILTYISEQISVFVIRIVLISCLCSETCFRISFVYRVPLSWELICYFAYGPSTNNCGL